MMALDDETPMGAASADRGNELQPPSSDRLNTADHVAKSRLRRGSAKGMNPKLPNSCNPKQGLQVWVMSKFGQW